MDPNQPPYYPPPQHPPLPPPRELEGTWDRRRIGIIVVILLTSISTLLLVWRESVVHHVLYLVPGTDYRTCIAAIDHHMDKMFIITDVNWNETSYMYTVDLELPKTPPDPPLYYLCDHTTEPPSVQLVTFNFE